MGGQRLRWFIKFLSRAIMVRKGRVLMAALSVMIAVGIIVSALGISLGIRAKLGSELKAYGANVMVSRPGGYLEVNDALRRTLAPGLGVVGYALQLYTVAEVSGPAEVSGHTGGASARVEVIGIELAKKALGLRVEGALPAGFGEVLVGVRVRDALGLKVGSMLRLDFGRGIREMRVSGLVESGGPEDSALIMDIESAGELAGLVGKASAALVRADTARMDQTVAALKAAINGAEVKTLAQVARAEQSFLAKIELLMALVAAVVLVASAISVGSTMSATVLERMKEIGLMKAMGGTRADIGAFFVAEGLVIGVTGGALGFALGALAAQAVSRGAFGSFIPVPLFLIPAALLAGSAVSVAASIWPLRGALKFKPSVILRGE